MNNIEGMEELLKSAGLEENIKNIENKLFRRVNG